MAKIFKAQEFVDIVRGIAMNNKTLYVYGCFGAPMNNTNKRRYSNNYAYNAQPARKSKINAASANTFVPLLVFVPSEPKVSPPFIIIHATLA